MMNSRNDLISAFLNALTPEELGFARDWIQTKLGTVETRSVVPKKITILYGTETGNAKKISGNLAIEAKNKGITSKVIGMDQYRNSDLAKEEYLFVVVSTQGEGEPPKAAKGFYDYLHSTKETYKKIKYTVLGLGDTSYPLFCQTGIDIDKRLEELGATRILELQKADVDFEPVALEWIRSSLSRIQVDVKTTQSVVTIPPPTKKSKNYRAIIKNHINLNDNKSEKITYHIEFDSEEPVQYSSGDIAVITPENDPDAVTQILKKFSTEPNSQIEWKGEKDSIFNVLQKKVGITFLGEASLKKVCKILNVSVPDKKMDLLDLLKPISAISGDSLLKVLESLNPITPRQYSIASSPLMNENEVHLTVAKDSFTIDGSQKVGLCSGYLGRLKEGESIQFTIKSNPHFHLPPPEKDCIMIGPGTGIAPFRAFVYERSTTQGGGRNWLFFGDRKFTENFLYQTEWQEHFSMGVLQKISLAWSRDGKKKYYVQDEIRKHALEFLEWLDGGAYLYICGAKDPMSIDVENTICDILVLHKKYTKNKAVQYLEKLQEEKRYRKDVY